MKNIILIGFMGAGKTTIGQKLARRLAMDFVDTDQQIEKEQHCTIGKIFRDKGEVQFRRMETELLSRLSGCEHTVISVGGGLPVRTENHEYLKNIGKTVYLKAEKETLVERLKGGAGRPLLQGGELEHKITELMQKRESIYERVADTVLKTDQKSPGQIVDELERILCDEC